MANPKLPGISESEQALLYAKLNEYNRGRASFKEAGVYLVVLPRPGKPNYSLWLYSPLPEKQSILYIHDLSPDINESLRIASTMFYYSRRCLILMDYNEKRMQSNGDEDSQTGAFRQNSAGISFGTSGRDAAEEQRGTPKKPLSRRSEREADGLKVESHAGTPGRRSV